MISGKQLLPVLIGAALGVGGWMYGIQNGGGSGAVSAGGLEDQPAKWLQRCWIIDGEYTRLRAKKVIDG